MNLRDLLCSDDAELRATHRFRVPVAVAAAAPGGRQTVAVSVRYQSCSEDICRQAITETVTLDVPVQAARRGR